MSFRKYLAGRLTAGALALVVCAATLSGAVSLPQGGGARRASRKTSAAARRRPTAPSVVRPTADVRAALRRISPDSLRGHLSFIASDALEGRDTPSRGLDLAAEYIAAQFRRAGLEPAGGDGSYFQTASWAEASRGMEASRRRARGGDESANVAKDEVKVRNVAAVLRGSDPLLRDTYVLLTAHYDHTGVRAGCPAGEDCVFNGANDDGSGTVSVVEIASALAALKRRPKRSILFMTFFGEEKGLLGSRYYGRHPLVPLEKTVAQVNLEQVGRTDDSEGPQVGTATVTGFDYTDVGAVLKAAGEAAGVSFYKHPTNSDAFFGRSDNQALADLGVPAHTVGVAFLFPDYHAVGDHWEKIDFDNMAKVDRAVALGLWALADSAREPRWDETNPRAARYVEAWRARRSK